MNKSDNLSVREVIEVGGVKEDLIALKDDAPMAYKAYRGFRLLLEKKCEAIPSHQEVSNGETYHFARRKGDELAKLPDMRVVYTYNRECVWVIRVDFI